MTALDDLAARIDRVEQELQEVKHIGGGTTVEALSFAVMRLHADVSAHRAETAEGFHAVTTELGEIRTALAELLRRTPPAGPS